MNVIINGEARSIDGPVTVEQLLGDLGLDGRKVAVERNLEIVPKSLYHDVAIGEGDKFEIVHFIGGGAPEGAGLPKDDTFEVAGQTFNSRLLVGTGKYKNFDGTVYFIFQPSEEDGRGALAMMDDGLFDKFPMQAIYGIHNMPGITKGDIALRSGQMMTSEDNFVIELNGKGGHASMPHLTIDPIVAGAEVVTAMQSIISRSLSPEEWGVLSITEFITDGARNIIPSNVIIKGDVRTLDPKVQIKIEKRMREIVDGIAKCHLIKASVEYSYEFIALKNSKKETEAAAKAAIAVVGKNAVEVNCSICPASEDFAQFLKVVPGCFVLLGAGEGDNQPPLHNPYYDYEDDLLTIGLRYWSKLVEQQLKMN